MHDFVDILSIEGLHYDFITTVSDRCTLCCTPSGCLQDTDVHRTWGAKLVQLDTLLVQRHEIIS